MSRYDAVIYGASGFTGAHIVKAIATNPAWKGKRVAVAGRSEGRVRKTLDEVTKETGVDLSSWPIIIADSAEPSSLANMAKQANVIINAVGPYRLYGDAVVKAAVENGASHVDISGEPSFLETTQLKYGELAKEKGVYVVGACGWDSIPCDLGVDFLKNNFPGKLGFVESYVRIEPGPHGTATNDGTYQTLILSIANSDKDGLGKTRRQIMPDRPPQGPKPPKRSVLHHVEQADLDTWALPFIGSDKSVVNRTQYYDYHTNNKDAVIVETYLCVKSLLWSVLLFLWLAAFAILCKFEFTRKILQKYPDQSSFNLFKKSGPTKEQSETTRFSYYFFGKGWSDASKSGRDPVDQTASAVCRGPDPGYIGTAGCITSAALTIINDKDKLPKDGGVYTTASAFRNTNIYKYLEYYGFSFKLL